MHLSTRLSDTLAAAREERGFTMLLVAVRADDHDAAARRRPTSRSLNDTQLSRNDLDQKRAYAAAQAGIAAYTYQLNQNVNYWETVRAAPRDRHGPGLDRRRLDASTTRPSR